MEEGYLRGGKELSNQLPTCVCMALEQRLSCQHGRDTSSARASAHVLGTAGGALGASLTVWVHPWAHMPVLSASTGSQVSPSLGNVLCATLSSWCLCTDPQASAYGRPARSDSSRDAPLKSPCCPQRIRAA